MTQATKEWRLLLVRVPVVTGLVVGFVLASFSVATGAVTISGGGVPRGAGSPSGKDEAWLAQEMIDGAGNASAEKLQDDGLSGMARLDTDG